MRRGLQLLTAIVVLLLALTPVLNSPRFPAVASYGDDGSSALAAESGIDVTAAEVATETSTATATETATELPTETATATATATELPAETATATATATELPTETATETAFATASTTATGTSTAEATATSTATRTVTSTGTATASPTKTATATRTATSTRTSTPRPTRTATPVARLSLSAASGNPGSVVRVQIGNFPANTRVAIVFDDARKLTLTTDRSGSARGSFTVPAAVAGSHEIIARGGGRGAVRPFTIRPLLGLSTTSIVAGRSLTVTLSGFDAGRTVKIRLYEVGSISRYVTIGEVRTSSTGGASRSLTIPRSTKGGTHRVVAYQTSSRNDDANLRVTALTATPTPRPAGCEGAQSWYNTFGGRNELVVNRFNNALALFRRGLLSESRAYAVAADIEYWAGLQANSRPPEAARRINEHFVAAYYATANAARWLGTSVRYQLQGRYGDAYDAAVRANQYVSAANDRTDAGNLLLPRFWDHCNID